MSTDDVQAFGELLRRHRLVAGLSQEALAEKSGFSVRGLSDLERGVRRSPHPATVARLAEALGLDAAARATLATAASGRAPRTASSAAPESAEAAAVRQSDRPLEAVGEPSTLPPFRPEERRWVTVVAAQLVGFAALADRLDPEDVQGLARRCAEGLSVEVRRFGGTVLHFTGDVLLAVFGAPLAHEDDAERAVRAGLALRDVRLIRPGDQYDGRLEVRVGVNTGEVMTGLVGPPERRDYTVMGGPVNVAHRLLQAASPGTVLVGAETQRATRHHARYRAATPVQIGEWERPLSAWEALGTTPLPGPRELGTTPLVGRDHELALLLGLWSTVVREARPHLVSLLGEPGIGKSRLVSEFERRVSTVGGATLLHGRCLPYGATVGYRALAMALREAADIAAEDGAATARRKLGDLVGAVMGAERGEADPRETERHLALLSGLDSAADRAGPGPDERIVRVSVWRFLERLARHQPLCVLIEDLHWADEALLDMLEFVAARVRAAPLLLVTQARPELLERRPTWGGGLRAFTSMPLEPLDGVAGRDLARALCGERGLPEAVAERVGQAAGGNPLFAEELSAALAEGREAEGVPSAIRALISARLDALPPEERQTLQRAAVFGRRVWAGGLAALGDEPGLADRIEALEQRDLLRAQPGSRLRHEREHAFKHDLIREVAYGQLPRADRRRLHGAVADWLERAAGERAEELLDLLAHHAVEAEQHDRALDYLARAAERARRAAAHREEAALLARAITIAERGGRPELGFEFRARRGRAFASIALWADARRELEAALAGLPTERAERRAEVLVDLARACNWSMDTPALWTHAGAALEQAEAVGRPDLASGARFWLAWAAGADGAVGAALDQYEQALGQVGESGLGLAPGVLPLYSTALCWAGRFPAAVGRASEAVRVARAAGDTDATIQGLQVLGLALSGIGRYDEATRTFDEAARFGRDHGVGPFLARSVAMSAGFHLDVYDFEGHASLAEEAGELARKAGFAPPLVSASIDLLLNLARRGEVGAAERLAGEVVGAVEQAGAWHAWLWALRFCQARAEIVLVRGDAAAAIDLASAALAQARGRRPKYETLALVTRGQARAALGQTTAALADLRQAVRIARAVGDPALFLRGAAAMLEIDGDDALASEAGSTAGRILASLPTVAMRQRFLAAEPVRRCGLSAAVSTDRPG